MTSATSLDAASRMDRMYRRQRHVYNFTRKFYLLGRDDLIARLAPPEASATLEIACGTGRNLVIAARRHRNSRFFGLDISEEMLATARVEIAKAGLASRIQVVQGDATAFDPGALFGVEKFERIFISYALSMIPAWQGAVTEVAARLAPGGRLFIVDFGDQAAFPAVFRAGLAHWLALFGVHPRRELERELRAFATTRGFALRFTPLYRRYAFLAELEAPNL